MGHLSTLQELRSKRAEALGVVANDSTGTDSVSAKLAVYLMKTMTPDFVMPFRKTLETFAPITEETHKKEAAEDSQRKKDAAPAPGEDSEKDTCTIVSAAKVRPARSLPGYAHFEKYVRDQVKWVPVRRLS